MGSYSIQQLYWVLLLINHAFAPATSAPGRGGVSNMLIDLNKSPFDETSASGRETMSKMFIDLDDSPLDESSASGRERISKMLIDLNESPLDELPILPPRTYFLQPTPSSEDSTKNPIAQSYQVRALAHASTSVPTNSPANDLSTGTRKRKSVDTSIFQTPTLALIGPAKRPMDHPGYQGSWSSGEEIHPEAVRANTAELRRKGKQVIESIKTTPSDENKEDSRFEKHQRRDESFDTEYWGFIRLDKITDDHPNASKEFSAKKIFNFLRGLQGRLGRRNTRLQQDPDDYFSIAPQCAGQFLRLFAASAHLPPYPEKTELPIYRRSAEILRTILLLSDEKFDLESHPIFSDILKKMTLKLDYNFENMHGRVKKQTSVPARIEIIKILTKCVTFLNIFYVSFLNKHESGKLTKAYIQDSLIVISKLWEDIEGGSVDDKYHFGSHLRSVLKFETAPPSTAGNSSRILGRAWEMVGYYADQKGLFFPPGYRVTLAEIASKIIFYSNYETISSAIQKERKL